MAHTNPSDIRVIFGMSDGEPHWIVIETDDLEIFLQRAKEFWEDVAVFRLVDDEDE